MTDDTVPAEIAAAAAAAETPSTMPPIAPADLPPAEAEHTIYPPSEPAPRAETYGTGGQFALKARDLYAEAQAAKAELQA